MTTPTTKKAGSTQELPAKPRKKADQYDDPSYNYLHYWDNRAYENAAEEMAIRRLLGRKHFRKAVDIGGGYGRLCLLLEKYADTVVLTDPSQQQLDIGKDFLKGHPTIERKLMQAEDLQFEDGSVDLFTMIRVMHHLPDPTVALAEISRTLSDDGYAIIEMANYAHMLNRVKHLLKGERLPAKPVDIRSAENRKNKNEIPFVNHNPKTVIRQLEHAGLRVERVLSVSNLRSARLKKMLPFGVMVRVESFLQIPLSSIFFGPSIFFLVRKSHYGAR